MINHGSPLLTRPGEVAVMPLRYYGSVPYYARLARFSTVIIDCRCRFDKRDKATHRFDIADTHGPLRLTLPVSRPDIPRAPLSSIAVSSHGAWWGVQRVSLESAFGRTPFFEFYIDRFLPFLSPATPSRFPLLWQLDGSIDAVIRRSLSLPTRVLFLTPGSPGSAPCVTNFTDPSDVSLPSGAESWETLISSAVDASSIPVNPLPYWQVRADRYGFSPSLSILDLLFNLGPESPLHLLSLQSPH